MIEHRPALAAARRVVHAVFLRAPLGGRAPPELRQRDRLQAFALRVREELGPRTIARAPGRRVGREELADRANVAAGVRDLVALQHPFEHLTGAVRAVSFERGSFTVADAQRALDAFAFGPLSGSLLPPLDAIVAAAPREAGQGGLRLGAWWRGQDRRAFGASFDAPGFVAFLHRARGEGVLVQQDLQLCAQ